MLHDWHSFVGLRFSHAPVAKQARGSHDRIGTALFYISSSNQLPPLHDDDLVAERAVLAYLFKTGEGVDEGENACGSVRGERDK